eukprot:260130_1
MASEIFVDRDASDEYLCIICLDVMNRPAQVGCDGGHIFCRECINPLIKASPSTECPVCRTVFHVSSIVEIPYIQRKIADLFVICPHHHSLSKDNSTHQTSITSCNPIQSTTDRLSTDNTNTKSIQMQSNPTIDIIELSCDEPMAQLVVEDAPTDTHQTDEDIEDIDISADVEIIDNTKEDVTQSLRRSKRIQQKHSPVAGQKRKRETEEDENEGMIAKRSKLNNTNDDVITAMTDGTEYCDWSGRYGDLSKHCLECPFELTKCTYATMGCKEKVLRKDMTLHRDECEYYPVQCSQCVTKTSRGYLSKHVSNDCMMTVIECENCSMKLVRKAMYRHLKHACGDVSIKCDYGKYGCEPIKRKDKATHDKECMQHHLELVTSSHAKLEDTVFQLALRVEDLETNYTHRFRFQNK